MVARPVSTADTTPVLETVAAAGLLDAHATARSVSTLPAASRSVTVSVRVRPFTISALEGSSVTDATGGGDTSATVVPLFPSLVAVMVAEPAPRPRRSPRASTAATEVSLLAQVTPRPTSTLPSAS